MSSLHPISEYNRFRERTKKPKIICYCGSIKKAINEFKRVEYESVINGDIALLPNCIHFDVDKTKEYKTKADILHRKKIDISDLVVVLNVNGYIGKSTKAEISYAMKIGKQIEYLEPIK